MTAPPVIGSTTSRDLTESWNELLKMLRAALLAYTNSEGESARDTLEERVYQRRPPDAAPQLEYPFAVMNLSTNNLGTHHGMRLNGFLEVTVYGRPWAQQELVNDICDLFDQAMLYYVANTSGLVFSHGQDRQPIPAGNAAIAVDGEVCAVRLTYTLAIWPTYLTSLTRVLT